MAILAFQRPEKVIVVESTASFGKFEFRPLEPGYAMTIGNALRRVLLSSLEGYAITTVKVDGVEYNFGSGQVDIEVRLDILAAIEGKVLESYNYLPMLQDGSMALLSQQVYYVRDEYNPIMGRGGIAYMKYNYNDAEWAKYVADNNGELKYT